MTVTTKSVVGNINNVSAGDITGMTMLFDLDPAWVAVEDTIIVGVQTGGVKGEPVTPDPSTGAFSVDLVAVDAPTWTITVTITGPTVEIPIVISISPPPAAGSGDVQFNDLIVPASTPGNPVIIVGGGGGGGAVDSVNGHTGVVNLTYSDVGALPSSYTPTFPVTSVAGRTGAITLAAADVSGALTETAANGLYAPISAVPYIIVESAGVYAGRSTVTADVNHVVIWYGADDATLTPTFAQGVDLWFKKAA